MTTTHDEKIEQAQAQMQLARDKAEAMVPQYKAVIVQLVASWADQRIEDAVTQKADVTKSLGKDRLVEMKARFRKTKEALPTLGETRLDVVFPRINGQQV